MNIWYSLIDWISPCPSSADHIFNNDHAVHALETFGTCQRICARTCPSNVSITLRWCLRGNGAGFIGQSLISSIVWGLVVAVSWSADEYVEWCLVYSIADVGWMLQLDGLFRSIRSVYLDIITRQKCSWLESGILQAMFVKAGVASYFAIVAWFVFCNWFDDFVVCFVFLTLRRHAFKSAYTGLYFLIFGDVIL